ncbi:MAG: dicarboxylate/amino acid:cation symporter [Fusobacteriaceae bacterium]
MKKLNLTNRIFIGLISGIILGIITYNFAEVPFIKTYIIDFTFNFIGNIFIRSIRMLVIPLIIFSLILGASGIEDIRKLGRIGIKTLVFYLGTTSIAIVISLFVGNFINPGLGLHLSTIENTAITISSPKPFIDILLGMIPINPIESMAKGEMLPIITFSIIIGVAISLLSDKISIIRKIVSEVNTVNLKLVEMVMFLAPFGVFGLIAKTFATLGYAAIIPIFKYLLAVVIALLLHTLITYQGLLVFIGKCNPLVFFKKFSPIMVLGFSTSSSAACLPSSLKTMEEDFGVSPTVASFTLPLGNTINMDGTAIMQGVATIFIAQVYGIDLTMGNYITIILTATLASIGTAGVPGVGIIMLGMVLTEIGLPLEGIGLVMGIDRVVDMFRTAINVTGDAVCTIVIAKTENDITVPSENIISKQ